MTRKLIITLAIVLLLFLLVFPQRDSITSVFQFSDEPVVISKGNYGQSIILEVSFSHDGFYEWIDSLKQPYPLLMVDAGWIERSPKYVELLKKKNIPVGLLGSNNNNEYTNELFDRDVAIYQKHFQNKPLWFMTSNYNYTEELKLIVYNEQINMVSPTSIYEEGEEIKVEKGSIISIPLHENSKVKLDSLKNYLGSNKFISIEENIFGYSIKSKKLPQ